MFDAGVDEFLGKVEEDVEQGNGRVTLGSSDSLLALGLQQLNSSNFLIILVRCEQDEIE